MTKVMLAFLYIVMVSFLSKSIIGFHYYLIHTDNSKSAYLRGK